MEKKQIVILGAGYAGLLALRNLQKKINGDTAHITLINKNSYHYESTWLHEASAGTLGFDKIRYSVEPLLNKNKATFIEDEVLMVQKDEKKVILKNQIISYDYLIVSLGFESETFGISGLEEHAFSITNLNASRKLHHHILKQFIDYHNDASKKGKPISIIVGGAGFTGIEFLGELVNKLPKICKEYDVDPSFVQVHCIEPGVNILNGFHPSLVEYTKKYLTKKGINFHLNTAIKSCDETGVHISKNGEEDYIKADIVIWAAGVRGNKVIEASGFESVRNKVKVDEYLRLPNSENIFIIGDCSLIINEKENRPYPPTAQISMQQGQNVASNIARIVNENNNLTSFRYKHKGTVCSLGNKNGVGVVFGIRIKGLIAAFMKIVIDNRALYMVGGLPLLFKKGK